MFKLKHDKPARNYFAVIIRSCFNGLEVMDWRENGFVRDLKFNKFEVRLLAQFGAENVRSAYSLCL